MHYQNVLMLLAGLLMIVSACLNFLLGWDRATTLQKIGLAVLVSILITLGIFSVFSGALAE
jgi:hypothetical protein